MDWLEGTRNAYANQLPSQARRADVSWHQTLAFRTAGSLPGQGVVRRVMQLSADAGQPAAVRLFHRARADDAGASSPGHRNQHRHKFVDGQVNGALFPRANRHSPASATTRFQSGNV